MFNVCTLSTHVEPIKKQHIDVSPSGLESKQCQNKTLWATNATYVLIKTNNYINMAFLECVHLEFQSL